MTDHAQIANHYTGVRSIEATGAWIAVSTCRRCGVAIVLDDSDDFHAMERHEAYHVLTEQDRRTLAVIARGYKRDQAKLSADDFPPLPAHDVAHALGGRLVCCELQANGVWMLTDATDRTYLGEFAA